MPDRVRDNPLGMVGWVAMSVVIHAGLGMYAGARAWHAADDSERWAERDEREATPDEIRPGVESSDAMVISWIGFEDPTPHSATPSDYDQPALALDSGAPAAAPMIESPAPTPTPEPSANATPAQQAESIERAMRIVGAQVEQGATLIADAGEDFRDAAEASLEPLRQLLARLMRPSPKPTARTAEAETSDPVPAAEPSEQTQSPADGGQGDPGVPADRESAPVSIANVPIEMRELGNPLAAAGLDIKTVRPRFTHYTRLTVLPDDPLIRVEFDRTGKVVKAELLESSGHRNVDNPILDAVYRWSASGKPLETLEGEGSPATIPIEFRIVL